MGKNDKIIVSVTWHKKLGKTELCIEFTCTLITGVCKLLAPTVPPNVPDRKK